MSGLGIDVARVRSVGSNININNNAAGGKIPFLKIFNDTAIAVDQSRKRPGAFAVYTEAWDLEIFDFMDLKKHNGDERRRAHDLFLAISYPDLFFKREQEDGYWTLFDPKDGLLLTETYGEEFEKEYLRLEKEYVLNKSKFNPNTRIVKARDVLRQHMLCLTEFGGPFIMFKDTINKKHMYPEHGIIRSSNLCVSGDTKLFTKEYGYVPIGSLVEDGIKKVTCWNGKQWSITDIFKTSNKQKVLKVTMSNGIEIHATPYHKWYIEEKDEYNNIIHKCVETKDLEPNMLIIKSNYRGVLEESDVNNGKYEIATPSNSKSVVERVKWLGALIENSCKVSNDNLSITYTTQHRLQAEEIYYFLLELGVYPILVNDNVNYTLTIDKYGCNRLSSLDLLEVNLDNTHGEYKEHDIYIKSIVDEGIEVATYCGNEPLEHKLMFNGVLTGNCTEITIPIDKDHSAVCNLGSLNMARLHSDEEMVKTIKIAIRALDNNIDLTPYPSEETKRSQMKFRSIGLGSLGIAEAIANKQIYYGSDEHKQYEEDKWKLISDTVHKTSEELSIEKGSCIVKGKRNAYLMAIAPNSSSAIFAGTTNGIEPVYNKVWVEENKRGSFILTAPNLTLDNYQYYVNPYEVDPLKQIEVNAIRQKYVDMSISMNLFLEPEGLTLSKIRECIVHAWKHELKTIYYLRSKPPKNNSKKDNNEITCVGCVN